MGNAIRHVQKAAVDAYDLSGVAHLVDVGGAHGQLMAAILLRYPRLTGVVFDLPEVVPGAADVLAAAGVADRAELVGGDYLTAVPAGGDGYVLSHVIHQVNDTDAGRILRNIRDVITAEGRVILVDPVLPEGDTPHAGKFMDITMMALTRGRDRTQREITRILADAGFRHVETIGSAAPSSVVVAVPV
jgi:predicted O-methyltransferase YrrM